MGRDYGWGGELNPKCNLRRSIKDCMATIFGIRLNFKVQTL